MLSYHLLVKVIILKDVRRGKVLKINKKLFVYTVYLKQNQGFTLIQTLFATIIIFLVLPLLISFLPALSSKSNYTDISMDHFFTHLRNEMLEATSFSIDDHKLL